MPAIRLFPLLCLASSLWAQTVAPSGSGADTRIKIDAKLYLTHDEVVKALGIDPGPNLVAIELTVTPSKGEKFYLNHDDFLLRSDRDGQAVRPMSPTEIAGSSVLVVKSVNTGQGQVRSEQRRQPYGVGIPGQTGRPSTLPSTQPPMVGNSTSDTSEAQASIEERKQSAEESAVLKALKAKNLPEQEIDQPVSGFLLFNMEGKQKVKKVELVYRKAPPRVSVRFEEPPKK